MQIAVHKVCQFIVVSMYVMACVSTGMQMTCTDAIWLQLLSCLVRCACRSVTTRGELRAVIVEMSNAAQVGKLSEGEAMQVTSEV